MKQNMLGASLKTCHWGYFDATLPPAMTISSGDEVVINTVSGEPQNLPGPGFHVPQELLDLHDAGPPSMPGHILTGPVSFGWIKRSIPDPTSRLILVAKAFMEMATPVLNSLELSLKIWDCAGIKSHDQRSRVLKKIDQRCEGYWVERRDGRTSVLHKC